MANHFIYTTFHEFPGAHLVDYESGSSVRVTTWSTLTSALGLEELTPITFIVFDRPDGKLLLHFGFASAVFDPSNQAFSAIQSFEPGAKQWNDGELLYDGVDYYYLCQFTAPGDTLAQARAYLVDRATMGLTQVWASSGVTSYGEYPGYNALVTSTLAHASASSFALPPGEQLVGWDANGENTTLFFAMSDGDTDTPLPSMTILDAGLYGTWPRTWAPKFHLITAPVVAVWRDFRNSRERSE